MLRKQQAAAATSVGEKSSMVAAAETLQSLSQAPVVIGAADVGGGKGAIPNKAPPPPQPIAVPVVVEDKKDSAKTEGHNSDSDSNYKMVIQNGVLMRKQKQRRYRTEKPYTCPHCTARFTLRSNMERHIKQQHPEFWASRPRGSRRNHAATVPVLAPQFRDEEGEESSKNGGEKEVKGSKDENSNQDEAGNSTGKKEEENGQDLASVSRLLDSATSHSFQHLFDNNEEDEEGDQRNNGGEEGEGEQGEEPVEDSEDEEDDGSVGAKKKSAYSAAPHKISCPYCSRKFPWTSSLKRHILTHTGDKPYKCASCPLLFTTKSNCDRHQVRKHGAKLRGRNRSGEDEDEEEEYRGGRGRRVFVCTLCPSATFPSERSLMRHQCAEHLDMELPGKDDEGADESSEEEEEEEVQQQQQQHGEKAKSLSRNGSEGFGLLPFRCHLCEEAFPERSEAIGHLQISHADDYDALVSRGAFSEGASKGEEEEEREEREDEERRRVTCLFCLNRFWSPEELRRHIRRHTGERPYTCDICHKRFTLKHSMLRHRKKHDSGVSSDGGSESDEAELQISSSRKEEEEEETTASPATEVGSGATATSTPTPPPPSRTGAGGGAKKRPSLMDTIAKLSSAKKRKAVA